MDSVTIQCFDDIQSGRHIHMMLTYVLIAAADNNKRETLGLPQQLLSDCVVLTISDQALKLQQR